MHCVSRRKRSEKVNHGCAFPSSGERREREKGEEKGERGERREKERDTGTQTFTEYRKKPNPHSKYDTSAIDTI